MIRVEEIPVHACTSLCALCSKKLGVVEIYVYDDRRIAFCTPCYYDIKQAKLTARVAGD